MITTPWLLRALPLIIGCWAEFSPVGPFSENCRPFHGKRIVMVTLNNDYINMFENWLHYAGGWLKNTEKLVVVAEDRDVLKPLDEVLKSQKKNNLTEFVVSSQPKDDAVKWGNDATKSNGFLHHHVFEPKFGTREFGAVMTQRPSYIRAFLDEGCTVLFSDIDNVWVHNPFNQIAEFPQKDILATDDDPNNKKSDYLCACFLYIQPTQASRDLVRDWEKEVVGQIRNHPQLNTALQRARRRDSSFTDAILPFSEFPPGVKTSQFPNATVIHANYLIGLEKKKKFLQDLGLWSAPERD